MPFFKDQQFQVLHQHLVDNNLSAAITLIDQWNPIYLALYQAQYPQDRDQLTRPDFNPFWQKKRDDLRLPQSPDFRFREGHLKDIDFVTGYLFYLLALGHADKDQKQADDALQNALTYSSIHALQTLVHQLIISPVINTAEYCDELVLALKTINEHAIKHGTAGYLLMAKGYMHLALTAQGHGEEARQVSAFKCSLQYLYWAQLAEADSANDTHNAYFGGGVALGNSFNIESLEKLIHYCRDLAKPVLPLLMQNFIKNEATRIYREKKPEAPIYQEKASHRGP